LALRAAVETVLRGELYVPPHVLPSHGAPRPAAPPPRGGDGAAAGLTPRQSEVLALVAQGLSNKEVGDRLDMSPSTVRAHVSAIFKTLGVENRTQAATSEVATALLGARTDRAR